MTTIKIDNSVWERIKKNLQQGINLQVSTGFFPEAKYGPEDEYQQVAQIARDNAEGTVKIPPRDFMRSGFGVYLAENLDKLFLNNMKRIADGNSTFQQEYAALAPHLTMAMKKIIVDWTEPPNSGITIKEKGFNDPLIRTGKMRDSVESRVEKGE